MSMTLHAWVNPDAPSWVSVDFARFGQQILEDHWPCASGPIIGLVHQGLSQLKVETG
jgi:hypothetical protein